MGIPIVQEIWDGLRWLIDFFFNKAPKPVLFAFFLLLLFVFSAFISFTIHLFGVHCTSTGDAVKVSLLNIGTNIQLAFIGANEPLNQSGYTPEPITSDVPVIGLVGKEVCFRSICFHNGYYYWQSESECDNETIIYPYKTREGIWNLNRYWRCSDCVGEVNSTLIRGTLGVSETVDLCFGNSYPIPYEDKNFYQRHFCEPSSQCAPPDDYYYDYLQNKYICDNDALCGVNLTNRTVIMTNADHILKGAHAELIYSPTMTKQDIKGAILFMCDREGNPIMTFFKIPIFDYRIWLLLALIFIMIITLTHMGQQSGLRR
ncbi:MAG: hypothetical protein MUP55_03540 [Candidatus Aenigmarchaeota archaeon]|nr:hypothetical protein [Candidatus Aenigmarchaeota archaeon]